MDRVTKHRLTRYLEGAIPLRRFYDWYMTRKCQGRHDSTEDLRVTLVLYEYTSEPIASHPDREEWLKTELADVVNCQGRWEQK